MKTIFALFITVMFASTLYASPTSVPCDSELAATNSRIIKVDTTKVSYGELASLLAFLSEGNNVRLESTWSGIYEEPHIVLFVKPHNNFRLFLIAVEKLERLAGEGIEIQCELTGSDAISFPSVSSGTR